MSDVKATARDGVRSQQVHRLPDLHDRVQDGCGRATRAWSYMWWNTVNTSPAAARRATGSRWAAASATAPRSRAGMPTRKEFGDAWEFNHEEVFFGGKGTRGAPAGRRASSPSGARTGTRTRAPASTRTATTSTCRASATTARTRPASRPARARRSRSAKQDGIVLIDEDRCRGYRFCMEACPYKKIYFNHVAEGRAEVHLLLPAHRAGRGAAPARAVSGPRALRRATSTTRAGRSASSSTKWKVALPLHPEFGTEPNVFYVPPLSPPRFDANGEIDESQAAHPRRVPGLAVRPGACSKSLDDPEGRDGEDARRRQVRAAGHADRLSVEGHVRRLRSRSGHASSGRSGREPWRRGSTGARSCARSRRRAHRLALAS